MEAIVRRVKLLLRQNKANRILVFSSWPKVLDVISFTLEKNKVDHYQVHQARELPKAIARLRKAVEDPKAADAVRVVLLPFKHGANGLNFTGQLDS